VVDDEAREKDVCLPREEVQKILDSYAAEKEERVLELRESLARREEYLQNGKQTGSTTRTTCGGRPRRQRQEAERRGREKQLKDLRKAFDSDISDTEAYIEDAAERMRQSGIVPRHEAEGRDRRRDRLPRAQGPLWLSLRLW